MRSFSLVAMAEELLSTPFFDTQLTIQADCDGFYLCLRFIMRDTRRARQLALFLVDGSAPGRDEGR